MSPSPLAEICHIRYDALLHVGIGHTMIFGAKPNWLTFGMKFELQQSCYTVTCLLWRIDTCTTIRQTTISGGSYGEGCGSLLAAGEQQPSDFGQYLNVVSIFSSRRKRTGEENQHKVPHINYVSFYAWLNSRGGTFVQFIVVLCIVVKHFLPPTEAIFSQRSSHEKQVLIPPPRQSST